MSKTGSQILLKEVKNLLVEIKVKKDLPDKQRKEFQANLQKKIAQYQRDYCDIYDGLLINGLS